MSPTTDPTSQSYIAPGLDRHEPDYAVSNLYFTHPKNYLGVPLAVAADGDTGALVVRHLVEMSGQAKQGAQALGLLDLAGNLTPWGERVVTTAGHLHGDPRDGLTALAALSGSSERFVDRYPGWQSTVHDLVQVYHPATPILTTLSHGERLSLPALVSHLRRNYSSSITRLFLRGEPATDGTPLTDVELTDPSVYRGHAVFQFKSLLFHCGVLTERGVDTSRLDPSEDCWELTPAFDYRDAEGKDVA